VLPMLLSVNYASGRCSWFPLH